LNRRRDIWLGRAQGSKSPTLGFLADVGIVFKHSLGEMASE
jgi:hypothetical protein